MNIYDKSLHDLCTNLQITKSDKEYYKFEKLVTVVNQAYLKIALKELNFEFDYHHSIIYRLKQFQMILIIVVI